MRGTRGVGASPKPLDTPDPRGPHLTCGEGVPRVQQRDTVQSIAPAGHHEQSRGLGGSVLCPEIKQRPPPPTPMPQKQSWIGLGKNKQTTPYISKPEFLVKEVRGCRPFPVARVPPHLPVSGRGASRAKGISPKSIFKHHNSRASQEERPKAHPQPSNLTFPSLS